MKRKEIAKFFCGFEVFHTLSHTYFLVSGTTLTIFGITVTPVISGISAVVNGIIAILLGVYAWKRPNPGGSMSQIPRDKLPESTLALLLDPYRFVSKRCRLYQTDLFQARLMFENTICMKGHEAAELFYNEDHFIRGGVAPGWLKKTLFGVGGVQGLDGEAHRHRKQMFMSLMDPERIKRLGEITANYFHTYAEKWMKKESITLYDEVNEILSRAVCDWAGVPLAESEVSRRTEELKAMFDRAAAFGPAHIWSRLARRRAERWIGEVIEKIRADQLKPPNQCAAVVIARHRDLHGQLLDRHTAAVELINVLRPTVAVSVFIIFAALALHQYPECRKRLEINEEGYADFFVQEVRRFYPFFPFVMARVRRDFEWHGYHFPQGQKVLLDLYGTDHDSRSWEAPEEFRPERFRHWNKSPFNFISQGGGDHNKHHRCPGEWIAIELTKRAAEFFARHISYDVPNQDLRINYRRLPPVPRTGFIIRNVVRK